MGAKNKPYFYFASDYTGLNFKGGGFYYGYEHSRCNVCGEVSASSCCEKCETDTEWCFVATFDGKKIEIPFSKLGTKDMFDLVENLSVGIGWVLAKYKLKEASYANTQ